MIKDLQIEVSYFEETEEGNFRIELWSKVKAKATLERKTMREVIFENLRQYITPWEAASSSDKKKKEKKGSYP